MMWCFLTREFAKPTMKTLKKEETEHLKNGKAISINLDKKEHTLDTTGGMRIITMECNT